MKAQQPVQCMVPRSLFGGVRNTSKSVYSLDSHLLLSRPSVSGAYSRSTQEKQLLGYQFYCFQYVAAVFLYRYQLYYFQYVAADVFSFFGHSCTVSSMKQVFFLLAIESFRTTESTSNRKKVSVDRFYFKAKKQLLIVRICPSDRFCRVQNLQTSCCCCFSHSAHWLPTRKKLLYTVANPARGLLNREKKKKKKSGSIERIWPITELYFRQILSTDFINRFYLSVIRQGLRIFQML